MVTVSPPNQDFIRQVAARIAREAVPVLNSAQAFRGFCSLVSTQSLSQVALGGADFIRDVGGAADAIYSAARVNERLGGEARALAGAAAHAKVAGQLGFDLARARVAVTQVEVAARAFKSPAAESALVFMRPELHRLEAAFESERVFQSSYQKIASGLRGKLEAGAKASSLGDVALAAEKIASRSAVGRGIMSTGRVLSNPWVSRSLIVLGIGIAMLKGHSDAPTNSEQWKLGYGVAAGISLGVSEVRLGQAVAMGRANPLVLLYDPAVKYGAKALGYKEKDADKYTIGTFYDDCAKSIVSLTQAVKTGDSEPMNAVHKQSMQGNGNRIFQGYSMIGDALSRSSLIDAALTRAAEWHSNVPSEFTTAPGWWDSLKSDVHSIIEIGSGALEAGKDTAKDGAKTVAKNPY
jgi:hypothetical protein